MARLDFNFDEHFRSIQKTQRRMLWLAPFILVLNFVLGLGFIAAAVFIVLALLRYFGVV